MKAQLQVVANQFFLPICDHADREEESIDVLARAKPVASVEYVLVRI